MDRKETEFRKRLLATFKVEAQDHIRTITAGLFELEKHPPVEVQAEIVETIFRDAHSLKGAARAVNIMEIESVCQSLEGVFSAWKKKGFSDPDGLFDSVYRAINTIKLVLSNADSSEPRVDKRHLSDLIRNLTAWEERIRALPVQQNETILLLDEEAPDHDAHAAASARTSLETLSSGTIRVSTQKLNSLLLQTEEMLTAKLMAAQHAGTLKEVASMVEALKASWTAAYFDSKPGSGNNGKDPDKLHNFFSNSHGAIKNIHSILNALIKSSNQTTRMLDRMVEGLLSDVKNTMLLPFSTLLEVLPMLVRDICHEQSKEADLAITGEGIEIDRRILEELKDPFIHLVRNSLDHGIEAPDERVRKNKPRRGAISVAIAHSGGDKISIRISDDGSGIETGMVRHAAVKSGAIAAENADKLDDNESLQLIFCSGVSTSPIVTDLSGRGLGLTIVREKIEKLSGSIEVKSSPAGTVFSIEIPLTIATFRGVRVLAGGQQFIIPTTSVERTARVKTSEIKTVENRETVNIDDVPVSLAALEELLEIPRRKKAEAGNYRQIVVISSANKRLALGVEEVAEEQEVLIKQLGKQLLKVRNVAGAAILGSGKPVPILNTADLLRSASRVSGIAKTAQPPSQAVARKTVLVVEDSITSRILLKNILESAGYDVKTAVDGIDAFTMLRTEPADIVVSDIEMPRMDGFDLTAKVRADKKLSEMPIILVTSLESREDKERGIEVGANAYIIKSSFNQGNLLEVIKRLI